MNILRSIALVSVALGLAGCASAPKQVFLPALGPAPGSHSQPNPDGFLQVFSARERAPIDVNAEEFFWNNDFGKNDFLHQPAHTPYRILRSDGTIYQRVGNARGCFDPEPTVVELPPGEYQISARAEEYNDTVVDVRCSVVIQPGLITQIRLDHSWQPGRKIDPAQLVFLPNGQSVGWRAQ